MRLLNAALAFLAALSLLAPVGAAAQEDLTPPVLLDFTISPLAADAGLGDVPITWCATYRDDLSGVDFLDGNIREPVSGFIINIQGFPPVGPLEDSFCGSAVMPQFSPYGTYQATMRVRDRTKNGHYYAHSAACGGTSEPCDDLCEVGICEIQNRPSGTSPVAIDWVTVGDPGNVCDPQSQGCFGAVTESYRISRTEVTNAQYAQFLNAVAATDTHGIYNASMGINSRNGGITQSGSPGSHAYTVKPGFGTRPVVFVSWYDALRFANWLHNGQPTGAQDSTTTEDGAYTFSDTTTVGGRNTGTAIVFLPTEDEWYKAAYYDPVADMYWPYPTAPLFAGPMCATGSAENPNTSANAANCSSDGVTDVGSYPNSVSQNSTLDQGGNVWEWNETLVVGSLVGLRGGDWFNSQHLLAAASRNNADPTGESEFDGFRVASVATSQEDTTPPVLLDFTISPVVFDTGPGPVTFNWCVTARDNLSGLSGASIVFNDPSGGTAGGTGFNFEGALEGTICSDTAPGTLSLPQFSAYGPYGVRITLLDQASNSQSYSPTDVCALGFACEVLNRPADTLPDSDNDGIPDDADNCPDDFNDDQLDTDLDLIGDVCDPFPNDRDNEQAQCEQDLGQCFVDLAGCQDGTALSQCQGDLATCDSNLIQGVADLGMCISDLAQAETQASECSADLGQCQLAEQQCSTDLGQCSSDLGVCDGERMQCSSDLATAEAELAALQADPRLTDADGDGEPDASDLCPDTLAGRAVDQEGCSPEQFCSQFEVLFSEGRSQCKKADWRNDEPRMRSRERDCAIDRGSTGRGDDRCVPVF